jgi:hypothetical protein
MRPDDRKAMSMEALLMDVVRSIGMFYLSLVLDLLINAPAFAQRELD